MHRILYHGHQLCDGSICQAQLVDHSWQYRRNSPSTDRMEDPDQREAYHSRIAKQRLDLLRVPSLGRGLWLSLWQIANDSLLLFRIEELCRVVIIRQEESCVYCTQDSRNAFENEHPSPACKTTESIHETDRICQDTADSARELATSIEESDT